MNIVRGLLVLTFINEIEAFRIAAGKALVRKQVQYGLFSSQEDWIVGNGNSVGASEIDASESTEDTEALSNLLDEMFQAKLEISQDTKELESLALENRDMPVRGSDGIYRIISQSQLESFKAANADKLIFLKFSSPICAACRMLKQKFQTLHRNPKFVGMPVVFADIVISNNKKIQDPFRDYITSQLRVRRIPSIHFYAWDSDVLVDQIFCDEEDGCSWPKIQQQMLDFVGQYYTPMPVTAHNSSSVGTAAAPSATISATDMTARIAARKSSKLQRIRRLLSFSWLR